MPLIALLIVSVAQREPSTFPSLFPPSSLIPSSPGGGGLVDPRLRASNEHIPIARAPRAREHLATPAGPTLPSHVSATPQLHAPRAPSLIVIFIQEPCSATSGYSPKSIRSGWQPGLHHLPTSDGSRLPRPDPFSPTAWKLPVAACLITLPLLLCSWLLTRLLQLPRPTQGGFLIATGLINSVYFSYPVVLATFGEEGLGHAVLFDVGQSLLTFTVVYGLAVWHGSGSLTARPAMVHFFSAPPLWAFCGILTLKLVGLSLPSWLHQLLTPIHLTTTPLASLVLGLSISLTALRHNASLALLGVVVRMGGGLLLGLSAVFLLNLTSLERAIVILVSAMPSAVNSVIFATETHLDEDLVASIVALSICIGIAVLPWLPKLSLFLLG